jgi:hypothetical protein
MNSACPAPLLLALLLIARAGAAQPAPLVEVDPIRCWWRTSQGAVAVGQPFTLTLTCAVLENEAVRVMPDESPLAVGAVQLAPFELVSGAHPADLRSGQRRFFQYEYTIRLIDPTAIDRDVKLPDLSIHYRVSSRVQTDALEGRDRIYLLPSQSVHISSTVPADATDIRDASDIKFGDAESLRFRARVFNIAAIALAALGALVLIAAAMRIALGGARRSRVDAATVSDRAILRSVASELTAVQSEAKGGWSPELASRAAAALRIAAGYAIGKSPRQRLLSSDGAAGDGRLVVTRRGLKTRRIAVTSPVTSQEVTAALETLPLTTPHARRSGLEELRNALASFTRALYAAETPVADMDEALAAGTRAAAQVRPNRR